jgi:cytochrome c
MIKITALFALALLAGCGEKPVTEAVVSVNVGTFDEIVAKASCLSCHQTGNQMNVPTWQAVAKKYQENKDAEAFLVTKIPHGGSGTWGKMDMPPFAELSKAEVRVLVQGVLASRNP